MSQMHPRRSTDRYLDVLHILFHLWSTVRSVPCEISKYTCVGISVLRYSKSLTWTPDAGHLILPCSGLFQPVRKQCDCLARRTVVWMDGTAVKPAAKKNCTYGKYDWVHGEIVRYHYCALFQPTLNVSIGPVMRDVVMIEKLFIAPDN